MIQRLFLFAPLVSFYLVLQALLRVVLWILYGREEQSGVALTSLPGVLVVGVFHDVVAALILVTPAIAVTTLLSDKRLRRPVGKFLFHALMAILVFMLFFMSGAEIAFFDEFQARFNLIAVSYLLYPTEVIGNIRESYPFSLIVPALVVASTLIYVFILRGLVHRRIDTLGASSFGGRCLALGTVIVAAIIAVVIAYQLPLGAYQNRVKQELARNGTNGFLEALRVWDIDYNQFYATIPSPDAEKVVRETIDLDDGEFVTAAGPTARRYTRAAPAKRPNLVILLQESLGAGFVGCLGGKPGLTPFLDTLCEQSLTFTNAFATGTRTVRGIEGVTASFPPIPSESIVKRPGSENIAQIGQVLRQNGYATSFIYGGYGLFDNMNHYFENNGYVSTDRHEVKNPKFTNIWGVSDEDLYRHSIETIDSLATADKPFFTVVLSTSNHKPYTFPENDRGIPVKGGGRDAGVRYADYAIESFFTAARTRPWFENTIIVVVADHDARVYGRTAIPVERYRIPVFIYGKSLIAPAKNDALFSQMDLAPTLLGLLGVSYTAPFFGQNVLSDRYQKEGRFKRWIPLNYNFDIGFYNGARLVVLGLNQAVRAFDCSQDRSGALAVVKQDARDIDNDDRQRAVSLFQVAHDLFKQRRYVLTEAPHANDSHS